MDRFHEIKRNKFEELMGAGNLQEAFKTSDNQVSSLSHRIMAARKVLQQFEEMQALVAECVLMQKNELEHSGVGLANAVKAKQEAYELLQARISALPAPSRNGEPDASDGGTDEELAGGGGAADRQDPAGQYCNSQQIAHVNSLKCFWDSCIRYGMVPPEHA